MANNNDKKAGKRMTKQDMTNVLFDFFHASPGKSFTLKYLFSELHFNTHPMKMLCMDILSELMADDYITQIDKYVYRLNDRGTELVGIFQRKSNGKNMFVPDGGGEPIDRFPGGQASTALGGYPVIAAWWTGDRRFHQAGEITATFQRPQSRVKNTLFHIGFRQFTAQ